MSEMGDIAYSPDQPLDESCYREARTADIFVLIIGGRYGSEASNGKKVDLKSFYDKYDSITKMEYKNAIKRKIPTYILIENNVYSEYHTYQKNKESQNIKYAHVDSINIFKLIEEILSQPKNNPIYPFERYAQIVEWLREQWAGLFRELLSQVSDQKELESLSVNIEELGEINRTLQRYLEKVIEAVSPETSGDIIAEESERLEEVTMIKRISQNNFVEFLVEDIGLNFGISLDFIKKARTFEEFNNMVINYLNKENMNLSIKKFERILDEVGMARDDLNEARIILNLPLLGFAE